MEQPAPDDRASALASWTEDTAPPEAVGDGRLVLVLESLRGLSAVRRRVRAFLTAGCDLVSEEACEDAVEKAVLVIDELTSNALRHGQPPTSLQVCDDPQRWIVVVRDAASHVHPAPAVDRPAGAGGYGLYVIADLTAAHGVHYESDHKLVWACMDKPTA
ncbi:MAG: Two component sensory transduction histidine kinase with sensory domain [Klenkia sp.]|nr:Two component sensory transduction histidine kinase with sensory domain [Klenkia sp.]